MVYAVLKATKAATTAGKISGKAILQGKMLGKNLKTVVPFCVLPASPETHSLPTIHHLAAKALLKDWQVMGKDSKEIVQLSIESSVISSHTAFIAIDEESSEPVTGAMKTWDVRARFSDYSSSDSDDDNFLSMAAPMQKRLGMAPASFLYCDDSEEEMEEGGLFDVEMEKEAAPMAYSASEDIPLAKCIPMASTYEPKLSRKGKVSPAVLKSAAPTTGLASFIDLQQANGSWVSGSAITEKLLGHSDLTVLLDACPVGCEGSLSTVWATVLVLTKLRLSYSSQQEEWELIAMKAESWLRRQQLPAGTTLEDMYKAAEKLLA